MTRRIYCALKIYEVVMITWEQRKAYYNKEYFVDCGHLVSEDGKPIYEPTTMKQCAEILHRLTQCKSVLDCGCSVGMYLRGFQLFDPTIKINGLELSEFAVQHSIPEVREFIQVCDVSDSIPFGDNSFDLVIAFDVLEHQQDFERLTRFAKEMCRVTKEYIFLRQPCINTLNLGGGIEEVSSIWQSLNCLPHKARLEVVDIHPQIISARPVPDDMQHPMGYPRKFWVALFESYGFELVDLPDDVLLFPNPLCIFSLNALMFRKIG